MEAIQSSTRPVAADPLPISRLSAPEQTRGPEPQQVVPQFDKNGQVKKSTASADSSPDLRGAADTIDSATPTADKRNVRSATDHDSEDNIAAGHDVADRSSANADRNTGSGLHHHAGRPMQKRRFAMGLLLSTAGLGGMLLVVFSAFRGGRFAGDWSLAAIGSSMIAGLMLLGGGFGIMATSSPTFDDQEFERLVDLGERGIAVCPPNVPDSTDDQSAWLDDLRPNFDAKDGEGRQAAS